MRMDQRRADVRVRHGCKSLDQKGYQEEDREEVTEYAYMNLNVLK